MLLPGDCRERMAELDEASVDAVVTDPPYALPGGFMSQQWDRFDPKSYQAWCQQWAIEALRVLKPGGWLLAFGGTRTYHRLTCGIEDAGWEIRDSIAEFGPLAWLYGGGFPKSKASLKPGWEPVVVARKPGPSLLNVDACRIGTEPAFEDRPGRKSVGGLLNGTDGQRVTSGGAGRWPANVVLTHTDCNGVCAEGCPVALLDQQSGDLLPGGPAKRPYQAPKDGSIYGQRGDGVVFGYPDQGGASRFFYTAKADASERVTVDGVSHPTVKPLALVRWLVRLVTPPGGTVLDPFAGSGTTGEAAILEGFDCLLVEQHEPYLPLIAKRIARASERGHQPSLLEVG